MDLSMILSPALEEESRALGGPPPRESNRNWSADELQCAVAILQDFQQPCDEPPEDAQHGIRGKSDAKNPFPTREQEERGNAIKRSIACSDDDIRAAPGREDGTKIKKVQGMQQLVLTDTMSKLDLLVQADAVIEHHHPKLSSSLADEKSEQLRSGVWSRAEEKYAARLVAYFLEGLLDLPEGITLRKFVAEKLHCNRRRVSMKLGTGLLAGQKLPRKVGASVFVAADPPPSDKQRHEIANVLEELRRASLNSGPWNSVHNDDDDGDGHSYSQRRLFELHQENKDDSAIRRLNKIMHHASMKKSAFKSKRCKPRIIRTGFESPEEEEFVTTMFEFFMDGSLDLPEGTKLVRYLCQQLGCTRMQLSMKLAPRRMSERKFPDNVGHIRYLRKVAGGASRDSSDNDDVSEEIFEVESRITELRLAHEEAHKNASPPVALPIKCERKISTASVSSTGTASVASTRSDSPARSFRRSGPWSQDEEVYAAALIDFFFKGVLKIAEGTTLRAFLSSRLCCNPMRISKKLASECIAEIRIPKKLGSSAYERNDEVSPKEQDEAEVVLLGLQRVYMYSSTAKRDSVSGSKRPRQSRGPLSQQVTTTIGLDSDTAGLESDSHCVVASYTCERSPMKFQKTAKIHTPAQEERKRYVNVPHGPALVVPALLKEQLA
ncbi:hypothetical protein KXD40_008337 [Peronospora effusa]|uniref:Uncharacterized protein n=1 Tax=Peronospora effusa TaxID=542832 RepID=A0A3M6V9N1_9STRA|nr:hypothetical protein DD238_008395 [Peronospora effusa]UIZ23955.1 hypothetical protein KXD40_008337 [Peronospora effusa]